MDIARALGKAFPEKCATGRCFLPIFLSRLSARLRTLHACNYLIEGFMSKLLRYLVVVSVFISGTALADSPASSGLGQSWPNTPDLSSSPRYHGFVFVKDGVRFIQVHDAAGRVRGALATGRGAQLVITTGSSASAEPVYQDDEVTITAQPQRNGTLRIQAAAACKDPITCNTQIISAPPQ